MKKSIMVCMIILAVGLVVSGCSWKGKNASKDINAVHEGIEVESKFKNVSVSTDVVSVIVEPSEDQSAHVRIESSDPDQFNKDFNFELKDTNDQLSITVEAKKKINVNLFNWSNKLKSQLYVQLPERDYKKIKIDSNVGKIEFSSVDVKQLDAKNDVGEIVVTDVDTEKTTVKNSVGSISLHNVNGKLDVKNSTGPVNMNMQSIQEDLTVSTDIGPITIDVEEEPDHIDLKMSTEIGKINTNFEMNYSEKSNRTVKGQKGKGGPKVKVSTEIGKIEMNHN